jgi:hypothetical protein
MVGLVSSEPLLNKSVGREESISVLLMQEDQVKLAQIVVFMSKKIWALEFTVALNVAMKQTEMWRRLKS